MKHAGPISWSVIAEPDGWLRLEILARSSNAQQTTWLRSRSEVKAHIRAAQDQFHDVPEPCEFAAGTIDRTERET